VSFVALVAFVLGGWHVATTKTYSSRQVASIAVATVVLSTLQIFKLIADGVPFPPALKTMLGYFGFFIFQIDTTRPECLGTAFDLPNKVWAVLFGVPGALVCGYFLHGCCRQCRHRDRGQQSNHLIRLIGTALLANVYWIWLAQLEWSWTWLGCSPTADNKRMLNAQQDVECFSFGDATDDDGGDVDQFWKRLVPSGILGLLIYQLAVPLLMIVLAKQPALKFATAPYRQGWKRRWLFVELVYRTALVLVKTFAFSQNNATIGSLVLLFLILVYHVLLIRYQPYSEAVNLHFDGALLYTFLVSGVTQLSLITAAITFSDTESSEQQRNIMEKFVMIILVFWLLLVLWLLFLYCPRPTWTKRKGTNAVTSASHEALEPEKWSRECFTQKEKNASQLKALYDASMAKISKYNNIVLTSFRRGGPNKHHELNHKVNKILRTKFGADYVHYQSGEENTLFGFGPSTADFAIQTSAGKRACKTKQETEEYTSFNMRVNWYIEWLVVLCHIVTHGGTLVLFDLKGDGAMASSPNCAMELALMYQLFGQFGLDRRYSEGRQNIRNKIRLVVIRDCDLEGDDPDDAKLAAIIEAKLGQNSQCCFSGQDSEQGKQADLFNEAHAKCARVLQDARATEFLRNWIGDFGKFTGGEGVSDLQNAIERIEQRKIWRRRRLLNRWIIYCCQFLIIILGGLLCLAATMGAIVAGIALMLMSAGSVVVFRRLFESLEVQSLREEHQDDDTFTDVYETQANSTVATASREGAEFGSSGRISNPMISAARAPAGGVHLGLPHKPMSLNEGLQEEKGEMEVAEI
jgi:hypothetical protein